MSSPPGSLQVSPHNPCPSMRASVARGLLANDVAAIREVTRPIENLLRAGACQPQPPTSVIRVIALVANGLSSLQVAHIGLRGLHLSEMRRRPLDTRGPVSRISDALASINAAELARLDDFPSIKIDADGRTERGLGLPERRRTTDVNFERATGGRRSIGRWLMSGEWSILLKLMGNQCKISRYHKQDGGLRSVCGTTASGANVKVVDRRLER